MHTFGCIVFSSMQSSGSCPTKVIFRVINNLGGGVGIFLGSLPKKSDEQNRSFQAKISGGVGLKWGGGGRGVGRCYGCKNIPVSNPC